MALLNEINSGNDCLSLIVASNAHAQLSDGPEAHIEIVKAISKEVFDTDVVICNTSNENFREEISRAVEELISKGQIDRVVTGDLDHPDGIIHYLRASLQNKHPKISFFSIGEKYMNDGKFDIQIYLADVFKSLRLEIMSVRLPDFKGIENDFVGKIFDEVYAKKLIDLKIDPLGEDGEYQSLVIGTNGGTKGLHITEANLRLEKGRDVKNYDYLVQEILSWKVVG
jgi:diphthamide synthase (EF-2-diphthine--ammonia ligase)